MSETTNWDNWLLNEDSVNALAPTGYDDRAAQMRVKDLGRRLTDTLATYEVRRSSAELYQDSTGLVDYRITAKGDSGPFASTLAWVLLSHFGDLATVKDCPDPDLTDKIRSILEDLRLKYIPYDYAAGKTYNGMCAALVGFSWANRYFSLVVNRNTEGSDRG